MKGSLWEKEKRCSKWVGENLVDYGQNLVVVKILYLTRKKHNGYVTPKAKSDKWIALQKKKHIGRVTAQSQK